MTSSVQPLAVRSAVENPIYFLVGSRDRLQVTAGLSPKNITGVLFQKMTFNSERNTLAFVLELIWKPPIYQNLIGAFREYMGTQCSKALGSEIRQTVNQLTITVNIPSKNGKNVAEASFSKMEIYRDSKGITILEFDVPVLLKPSEPFVKDPIYEEVSSDGRRVEHRSIPPQVNMETHPNKVLLQDFNSEPVTESVA